MLPPFLRTVPWATGARGIAAGGRTEADKDPEAPRGGADGARLRLQRILRAGGPARGVDPRVRLGGGRRGGPTARFTPISRLLLLELAQEKKRAARKLGMDTNLKI